MDAQFTTICSSAPPLILCIKTKKHSKENNAQVNLIRECICTEGKLYSRHSEHPRHLLTKTFGWFYACAWAHHWSLLQVTVLSFTKQLNTSIHNDYRRQS